MRLARWEVIAVDVNGRALGAPLSRHLTRRRAERAAAYWRAGVWDPGFGPLYTIDVDRR